jgi:hypothetical protein
MARKKTHPSIGRFNALFEHNIFDPENAPELHETAEEALQDYIQDRSPEQGEVVYIYQLVAVKRINIPVLAEDYVPEPRAEEVTE